MTDDVRTNFNWGHLEAKLDETIKAIAAAAALQIEGQTKLNINQQESAGHQGLIDTGFYVNSVYSVTEEEDSYGHTNPSGQYRNREGEMVTREIAPKTGLPNDALAAVAIGASYAIYLENKHQVLYRAAETVAKQAGKIIEPVAKEHFKD